MRAALGRRDELAEVRPVTIGKTIGVLAVAGALATGAAMAQLRQEAIRFAPGATSARVTGSLRGDADIDYLVTARAGQVITVTLAAKNASVNMNVLPPGSEEALFIGSISGTTFEGPLPRDGQYRIRVYLMRSAARRNATASFTLSVSLTGGGSSPPAGGAASTFDRTVELHGIRFHVSAATHPEGGTRVRVAPAGLLADNSIMERVVSGTVTGAEVGDLNADGSPEIYVYVAGSDADAHGSLVAFSANRKRSLSEIALPDLAAVPAHAAGYRGHDQFAVLEGVLGRRFPIYSGEGPEARPSGKTRQLQYRLAAGEAAWQLRVDRVTEF